MRFYLVDRIDEMCPGKYVKGIKCVSMSDDVFNEHFPGYPIFPGSLILEGLAQLAGLFFEHTLIYGGHKHKRAALTLINKMKYRKIVIPGDCLEYLAEVKMFYPDEYAVATVKATCNGKLCAQGELFFGFIDILTPEMESSSKKMMELAFRNTLVIEP